MTGNEIDLRDFHDDFEKVASIFSDYILGNYIDSIGKFSSISRTCEPSA